MRAHSKFVIGTVLGLGLSLTGCGSADPLEPADAVKAAETGCESAVLAETASRTCNHPFVSANAAVETADGTCSIELLSAEFGTKYGAKGVSPTVSYEKSYEKRGSSDRNMAKFAYETALDREKGRGNFKNEVPNLGEAAFYAKVSIGRNVYWYDGDYFYMLSVDDGHSGDSNYRPYCPPENLPLLAREIHQKSG